MDPAPVFDQGDEGLPAGFVVLMAEGGFKAPAPVRSAEAESGEGKQAQELPEAAEGVEQVTHRLIVVWRRQGGAKSGPAGWGWAARMRGPGGTLTQSLQSEYAG